MKIQWSEVPFTCDRSGRKGNLARNTDIWKEVFPTTFLSADLNIRMIPQQNAMGSQPVRFWASSVPGRARGKMHMVKIVFRFPLWSGPAGLSTHPCSRNELPRSMVWGNSKKHIVQKRHWVFGEKMHSGLKSRTGAAQGRRGAAGCWGRLWKENSIACFNINNILKSQPVFLICLMLNGFPVARRCLFPFFHIDVPDVWPAPHALLQAERRRKEEEEKAAAQDETKHHTVSSRIPFISWCCS